MFSLLATFISGFLGRKLGIIDLTSQKKIHKENVPRSGGIGILFSFLLGTYIFHFALPFYQFVFIIAIFLIGLSDDIFSVPPNIKFAIEIGLNLVLAICSSWKFTGLYLIDIAFATFYLVGAMNALNIVDGMDGLAAGIALIACSFLYKYAGNISLLIAVICGGFIFWNFHKAKIFMGDSGSLLLGGLVGLISLRVLNEKPEISTFISLIFIYAIPIYDSALSIIRRLKDRKELFKPDIDHFYNKLYRKINNYVVTVVLIYIFSIILGLIGIGLYNAKTVVSLSAGIIIWTFIFFVGYKLGFLSGKNGKHTDVGA